MPYVSHSQVLRLTLMLVLGTIVGACTTRKQAPQANLSATSDPAKGVEATFGGSSNALAGGSGEIYSGGNPVRTALESVRSRAADALERMQQWDQFAKACAIPGCEGGGDPFTCALLTNTTPSDRTACEAFCGPPREPWSR